MARLLPTTADNMALAAESLRCGRLVAFPTETVYGLGCNALDAEAAERVFRVKGRPTTDPLIVHVVDYEAAFQQLWAPDDDVRAVARALATALWPGPLTLVARATSAVPRSVTGQSGFVGLRVPDHPVAQRLITAAGLPIAAPSANLFGHVSPTSGPHVMNDLADRDDTLIVLDGGDCAIGIESTVVKISSSSASSAGTTVVAADGSTEGRLQLEILRRGRVSADDVVNTLRGHPTLLAKCDVSVRDTRSKYLKHDTTAAMDGPGQLLTHYAPCIPTFLLTPASLRSLAVAQSAAHAPSATGIHASLPIGGIDDANGRTGTVEPLTSTQRGGGSGSSWVALLPRGETVAANDTVIIDFGDLLHRLHGDCLACRTLSSSGDVEEACRGIFDALRWSETVRPTPKALLIPMVTEFFSSESDTGRAGLGLLTDLSGGGSSAPLPEGNAAAIIPPQRRGVALMEAVEDRLFRAASGRVATIRYC